MCNAGEVNFKKDFCLRYFDDGMWSLDVLNKVDVLLQDKKGQYLLYIESKATITSEAERREAIAQVILTNKKQESILSRVALIYQDADHCDVMEVIDCSDDSVMYNNDINWQAEKASAPSRDAIASINDRVKGRVTVFRGAEEISGAYKALKRGKAVVIDITERNFSVVYNHWKREISFHEQIPNEQDLINLFLVDLLNGTKYERFYTGEAGRTLFGFAGANKVPAGLIREGTNLNNYRLMFVEDVIDGIKYKGYPTSYYYHIENVERYYAFWRRYKRPPEEREFMKILEHSSMLYSEKYRKDTGGEYTPSCFVELQNEILSRHYDLNEFVVCDPCAGVGNLENQFGKDYKHYCYLSTLATMDVDTCRIKGFENAIQFDYLATDEQPKWKFRGDRLGVDEIARREGRKLMVVMNPPYQRKKGIPNDLAIEFFNKVLKLQPDVIVYYCKTEFFLRPNTLAHYVRSGYRIAEHVFSNAKTTFRLSEWAVSLVVFDREKGEEIKGDYITAGRYEYSHQDKRLEFVRDYRYDNVHPCLIKEIEKKIWEDARGAVIGQWCYLNSVLKVSNGGKEKQNKITTQNLKWCLLSKGLSFNTHHRYFEWNYLVYRGTVDDIPDELFSDAVMFSLFYKGNLFTNKGQRNYIMPFTAEELGCARNELNVLYGRDPDGESCLPFDNVQQEPEEFDFRCFLHCFTFSAEARELYQAALQVFRFYHHSGLYPDSEWNDSFYDVANAIMGRDVSSFRQVERANDRRITRVKTTKGTKGFGRRNVQFVVAPDFLPVFEAFFDARDALARKINRQLVDSHLLLWERENIY